jgi:hypothetical protein
MKAIKKESKKTKNATPKKKIYVKPTVAKHTAASVVVGSCGMYVSSSSGGDYWY